MGKKYDEDDIKEMVELIEVYDVEYDGCGQIDCESCDFLENCYHVARKRENGEWAKLIYYSGCDTEEKFWEQLLD